MRAWNLSSPTPPEQSLAVALAARYHPQGQDQRVSQRGASMKITDLKCVILGQNPVIRIVTDEGIDGYGEIESTKPYVVPNVLFFKEPLLGEDPTNVERVMLKIRQRGAFKPWGSAISAIEMALWDIAGKAAGVPVYKLLGGNVRDRVRIYNGGLRFPIENYTPEEYAESTRKMLAAPEG